jgi:hypothetical protein
LAHSASSLTFGGASNPSQWSDVSEIACNLTNDLVCDPGWDPDHFQSSHQPLISNSFKAVPDTVPFAQPSALMVELPNDDQPKADCYIDDIFAAFLEQDLPKGSRIIPFVISLLNQPLDKFESVLHDDMLSIKKFLGEAMPAECKVILGWLLDTCHLSIELPEDKHAAWTCSIEHILSQEMNHTGNWRSSSGN